METDFSGYSQATTSGPDFSSASMGLSDEAMASIGSDENQDRGFFGGSDATQNFAFDPNNPNIMDFGRGSVSNITNAVNYDPNFAALGMMGRGLTPGFDLRNQINFDVPNQMLPQLEGSRGPLAPKFYSPLERTLVEMEPVGIGAMIGKAFESVKNSFNEAKDTLGKMGNAVGGLSLSDLGIFSSDTGQKAMADMEDNVSFDQFGRRIDLGDTRQIADFQQPIGSMQSNLVRSAINQRNINQRNFETGYDDDPLIDIQPNRVQEVRPYGIFRDQLGRPQLGFRPTFQT